MSDIELLLVGGGISLATTFVTVFLGEWFRASNMRKHDQERFALQGAEQMGDRERERQRQTLEGLQIELGIIRGWLIWYRNISGSPAFSAAERMLLEVHWAEKQQALIDAGGTIKMLASRYNHPELSKLVDDAAEMCEDVGSLPPEPGRANGAQAAPEHLREVRLLSGQLLQGLWGLPESPGTSGAPSSTSAPLT